MNMLDEGEDDSFHVTRESYPHLSDSEWGAVGRMSSLIGEPAISGMLESLDRDGQHTAINNFIEGELVNEREKMALVNHHSSHRPSTGSTYTRRSEPLKLSVTKYEGDIDNSILRWFVEIDEAIRARRIDESDMQVSFALSNLTGRARDWALGLKLHDPYVFGSLDVFKSMLRETFEPPRAESRSRSALLRLKQGKRDVHSFAQELRYLANCVIEHPVDEHTLIEIFMDGLADGPVRTYMFREEFQSLNKAIAFAEQEDYSLRRSQAKSSTYRPPRRQEVGGSEPMELCRVESEKPRSPSSHKRTARCHRCQKIGHYAYECSVPSNAPRPKTGRDDRRWPNKGPRRGSDNVAKQRQQVGPSKNGQGQ